MVQRAPESAVEAFKALAGALRLFGVVACTTEVSCYESSTDTDSEVLATCAVVIRLGPCFLPLMTFFGSISPTGVLTS